MLWLAVAAGYAQAQQGADILLELPDKRVVKLNDTPQAEDRLNQLIPMWMQKTNWRSKWFTVMAPSETFCPWMPIWTDSEWDIGEAQSKCDSWVRSMLSSFDDATRARCKCVKVLEGRPGQKLKVVKDVVLNAFTYSAARFAISKPGTAGEVLRGYWAASSDEIQLFTEGRDMVCSGKYMLPDASGNLSCFNGRIKASGSYRDLKQDKGGDRYSYILGRFNLTNRERLDIVTVLTDAELKRFHPSFPN